MEETKSQATGNRMEDKWNGRQQDGMEDSEMEWKTRPMLG
jgi:hypothetical protein